METNWTHTHEYLPLGKEGYLSCELLWPRYAIACPPKIKVFCLMVFFYVVLVFLICSTSICSIVLLVRCYVCF